MTKLVFRNFSVGLDTSGFHHAIFDMANLPEKFRRTFSRIEPAARLPFVGVTTDGHPIPDLYELKETGLSTRAVTEAARDFLAALPPQQLHRPGGLQTPHRRAARPYRLRTRLRGLRS